jgi:hypothetical protein
MAKLEGKCVGCPIAEGEKVTNEDAAKVTYEDVAKIVESIECEDVMECLEEYGFEKIEDDT